MTAFYDGLVRALSYGQCRWLSTGSRPAPDSRARIVPPALAWSPFWCVSLKADADDPQLLAQFEGLIHSTAKMILPFVEEDFDDVVQQLRIKVWQALMKWDPKRAPQLVAKYGLAEARRRSVFAWVRNKVKDLVKRKKRGELSIEDLTAADSRGQHSGTRDAFEQRYQLSTDDGYAGVEEEPPLIPSTLTLLERKVVCLLYSDYRQTEVARYLGLEKREVERHVRSIRDKMADWAPASAAEPDPDSEPEPESAAA